MTAIEKEPSSGSYVDAPTVELPHEDGSGPWALEVGSPGHSETFPLAENRILTIGSSRRSDIRVDDPTVSSKHARLEATPNGVRVEDLDSKNGVHVGGARVRAAWLIGDRSSFVIGQTTITVTPLRDFACEPVSTDRIGGLVGSSLPMRRLFIEIRRCAAVRAPVLIQGESGSGKDVVARAIHEISRRTGPYVPLNVGALPESLADAELFGHRRGAFTGAVSNRAGAFEHADRGTLFLDEIAELPASIQVKLLRVVEDGQIRPVGGVETESVDVRIVSASWAPLDERVASGAFREDLYHRISTFVLRVPPLRSRKSDVSALCRVFLARLESEVGPKELTSSALARLVAHTWPGNVRELGSVLYRAAVRTDAREIGASHVEAAIDRQTRLKPRALSTSEASLLLERSGSVSAAARAAGVPRSTFRSWLAKG
jgi:transcriptional regulator with GAF, ATPase, and Fis domain